MNEDGTMNRDEVQHFFKSNMTSKLYVKLTSIFYACIDLTDKIAKIRELNPCKRASLHEFCVVKGIITSHDLHQVILILKTFIIKIYTYISKFILRIFVLVFCGKKIVGLLIIGFKSQPPTSVINLFC